MEKTIKIKFNENCVVDFQSDTPDFKMLVGKIIENKDMDFSLIDVTCEDDNFDANSFKSALIETIASFLNDLKINKENLDNYLKELDTKNQELNKQNGE